MLVVVFGTYYDNFKLTTGISARREIVKSGVQPI